MAFLITGSGLPCWYGWHRSIWERCPPTYGACVFQSQPHWKSLVCLTDTTVSYTLSQPCSTRGLFDSAAGSSILAAALPEGYAVRSRGKDPCFLQAMQSRAVPVGQSCIQDSKWNWSKNLGLYTKHGGSSSDVTSLYFRRVARICRVTDCFGLNSVLPHRYWDSNLYCNVNNYFRILSSSVFTDWIFWH
jgi:hypothetical protein